ncbi:MAG: deoxyguanosinetriphosphate triphosphohydrolase [Terrimicrobiaceae bacterium]|nr:deoxyguanosinetriphosphate triphosphohydrolase [Terrimicrobiaceae bacterium]
MNDNALAELLSASGPGLAPWAVPPEGTGGRRHAEAGHDYRPAIQRDRARIIHCAAFRRLDGKTQVFLNGTGDHYRTRLTHTMEVASVSRTLARALRLNEDLAEAVALAHDLGHPPCGHTGEEELNSLLREHGGFDHNVQSLRIVETLEEKYPDHPGLNLTWDVREGIQKHADGYTDPKSGKKHPSAALEGQLTDLADEITYSSHDLDDGLDAGLLTLQSLEDVPLWARAVELARSESPRFDPGRHRGFVIRCLVNFLVDDLVYQTAANLLRARVATLDDIRNHPRRLAAFSPAVRRELASLRRFLFRNLYHHPEVAGANRRAADQISGLFEFLVKHPSCLGRKAAGRIRRDGLERSVGDYISGMTDRYLAIQHAALLGVKSSPASQ